MIYKCKWCSHTTTIFANFESHEYRDHYGFGEADKLLEMANEYQEKADLLKKAARVIYLGRKYDG